MYKETAVLHVQGNCSTGYTRELQYCIYKITAILHVQGNCSTACKGNFTVLHLQENCSTACTKELQYCMYKGTAQYCIYKRTAVRCMYKGIAVLHVQGSAVLNVHGNCSTACTWKDDTRLEWLIVFNRFFKSFNKTRNIFKTVCC